MTITASPETDLAVAKACRFQYDGAGEGLIVNRGDKWVLFSPSTNLNASFLAAEKFRLFAEAAYSLQLWHVGWTMVDENRGKRNSERIVQASSTPALAICAAILKLAEKP